MQTQKQNTINSTKNLLAKESSNKKIAEKCFHCGLPNEGQNISFKLNGRVQSFCCQGCKAVAELITELGNDDYYLFRKNYQVAAFPISTKKDKKQLSVYDETEIQKDFVRHSRHEGEYLEAFLLLENLRCAACVWLNEQHLRKLHGILEVHVDYTSSQARVKWNPQIIKLSEILQAIEAIGYSAQPFNPVQREKLNKEQKRKNYTRLLFSAILGMEVMMHAVATYWMGGYDAQGHLQLWEKIGRYTDLIVVTVMLFYTGADFYISAWRDMKNKHLGMDIPVVLGLSVAYLGSFYATITQQGEVYFDSIAMFLFLMLAAKIFELKGRIIAGKSIDRLLKISPKTAHKIINTNQTEETLIINLKRGDKLIVNPGEIIPVDGKILHGSSSFDESLLTGEMMPVLHHKGDVLMNGSCNIDQKIMMSVENKQLDSTLFTIYSLLEKVHEKKTKQALLSSMIARWFVIFIILIASVTAIFWYFYDVQQLLPVTIAVLIVSCPCALALATPVAISISSGKFASRGIMPLNMPAFDDVCKADTVIFDKTGTLTQGRAKLIQTVALTKSKENNTATLINIAASLEWQLLHPIARAFNQSVKVQPYAVTRFKNYPGEGIEGEIKQDLWRIGKISFCSQLSNISNNLSNEINAIRESQATVIGLSKNSKLIAYFVLVDPLKESAKSTIKNLKKQGIKNFIILSGDNQESVKPIARALSINNYYGSMTPVEKLTWVKNYKQKGHKVIMVGDGINDAPTLAVADASVSFSHASDVAQINSDFVLLKSDLSLLANLHKTSMKTHHIISQNFTWALVYNVLAIPFAASGFLPPWVAALGMSVSSFIVIGNSLRLNTNTKVEK